MFDRKSIKEYARFRLKAAHWLVVGVVLVASLLGGFASDIGNAGINLDVNLPTDSAEDFNLGDWFDNGEADPDVWEDAIPDEEYDPDIWDEGIQVDPDDGFDEEYDPGIWEDSNLPQTWEEWKEALQRPSLALGTGAIVLFLLIFLFVLVIVLAMTIFLGNVVTVGVRGWLLRFWRGETPSFAALFDSFRIYGPSLKAMLVRDIYTFLWSLLFFIPGIIKSFAYSMVPYIIYENPNLTPNQAIDLSDRITKGAKGKLFVLGLSFFGWNLLSALTAGILGILYVDPYAAVTYAGVYEQLKWDALQSGRVDWTDFGQAPPSDGWAEPAQQPAPVWEAPEAAAPAPVWEAHADPTPTQEP